jgi:hypothetical protein
MYAYLISVCRTGIKVALDEDRANDVYGVMNDVTPEGPMTKHS